MDQQNQVKTNLTNSTYQSQFLPLVEKAGVRVKELVVYYALHNKSRYKLQQEIEKVIADLDQRLPNDLTDRQNYINGLRNTSFRMIRDFYIPTIENFSFFATALIVGGFVARKPTTPKDLINTINKTKTSKIKEIDNSLTNYIGSGANTWEQAKGVPYIENYPKRIKERMNGLAKTDIAPTTEGKKPITIWQKAELDIRHEHQMEMVGDLMDEGVVLCWISSHPDCSKRCARWQGKLVDIIHHAEMSGFRMKHKVDGHTVYSLRDIMNQTDKYGYKNNIINGFNCRHRLIPYKQGSIAPREYDAETLKKERIINANLRKMETNIRHLKQKANLYAMIDKKEAKLLYAKAKTLEAQYKAYANANGFAWYQYRIQA